MDKQRIVTGRFAWLMKYIRDGDTANKTATEIGKEIHYSENSVQQAISELIRDGLIERRLCLTDEGIAVLDATEYCEDLLYNLTREKV